MQKIVMMKKRFKITIIFFFLLLNFFHLSFSQDETITVTSYYPSPYGVYGLLRLYPQTQPSSCEAGDIYFDQTSAKLYLCIPSEIPPWQPIVLFSEFPAPIWSSSSSNIYYNAGKVGIGLIPTLAVAKLTVGQLYNYIRDATPVAGIPPAPLCPLDIDNTAEDYGLSFPSITDLGPTCYDRFEDASSNPMYYGYQQEDFPPGDRLNVTGRSRFDGKVAINMGTLTPSYDLEVNGSFKANNYRSENNSLGDTRVPIVRNTNNTADCTITIKDGLITGTTCP